MRRVLKKFRIVTGSQFVLRIRIETDIKLIPAGVRPVPFIFSRPVPEHERPPQRNPFPVLFQYAGPIEYQNDAGQNEVTVDALGLVMNKPDPLHRQPGSDPTRQITQVLDRIL